MSRPRGWALRSGIAVCLLAAPHSGCSFLLVRGPPAESHQMTSFECTSEAAAPAVDGLLAVVGGLSTLFLIALSGLSDTGDKRGQATLWGLPLFVLPASSAVYGFAMVSRCRGARADLQARQLLGPPPAPPIPAPPPAIAAPLPAGASWRPAILRVATPVHSAPFEVAPVVQRLAAGERVTVSTEARAGWRRIALPGGFGYLPDAAVTIDSVP